MIRRIATERGGEGGDYYNIKDVMLGEPKNPHVAWARLLVPRSR